MKHIVMTIAVALAAALLVQVHAQVLLNEVASTNPQLVADESSEYPDWIELYNSGLTTVNIAGWSLTDNPLNPDKWLLPDIDLAPAERLLVFASGNDLNSFTPDTGPATNHWETVMNDNSAWQYFVGTSQPEASWNTDITNASGWSSATGGFGYGDGDDGTNVPAGTVSVYYRKTFTVANEADWAEALLSIDYDDAFIAYLNGTEIARYGLSGVAFYDTPSELDHEAQMYQGGDPDQYLLDYTTIQSLLVPGTNVLAIEVHNVGSSSSDLTGRTWLHAGIASATTYYGSNPSWFIAPAGGVTTGLHTNFKISYGETVQLYDATGLLMDEVIMNVQSGHARARIPDAGSWCYTNVPTPDSPNTGTCYSGYANTPTV
ncbi:MAG: lamin tail domain-containing protein, partial [Flavobacteriales bacterium]|nr:lamin tail domain-containing protein [Flavobacteriales bacterium]